MAIIPQIIALRRAAALTIISTCVISCGQRFDFLGSWEGTRSLRTTETAPSFVVKTANQLKLWVHPNGEFDLQDMGIPKHGEISVQGDKAVLTVTKIADHVVANDADKPSGKNPQMELTGKAPGVLIYNDPTALDPTPVELKRIATSDTAHP